MVKTLRERTGAGMMECKKALVETGGDLDAAAEIMRKAGLAKADKKAARIAAEGAVVVARSADGRSAVLAEVNCETDFVAREQEFQAFAAAVAAAALQASVTTVEDAAALPLAGGMTRRRDPPAPDRQDRREHHDSSTGPARGSDRHRQLRARHADRHAGRLEGRRRDARPGPRDACGGGEPAVSCSRPTSRKPCLPRSAKSWPRRRPPKGKPAAIVDKMVEGRLRKYLAEICLTGQPFVKDPDTSVGKLLEAAGATVTGFLRYEVGEGIEKKQENFAEEVMAQVKAAEGRR